MKISLYIVSCFFILLNASVSAQEVKKYRGDFKLSDSITGLANYDYQEINNEKKIQGKFLFYYNTFHSKEEEIFYNIELIGDFKKGTKESSWFFSRKKLQPTGNFSVDGYGILRLGTGQDHQVNASFSGGQANGLWSVLNLKIKDGDIGDTSFVVKSNFKNNHLFGEFMSRCDSIFIIGNIDENGFFDGKWVFDLKINGATIKETREYRNGILIEHRFTQDNSKEIQLKHIGLDTEESEGEIWEDKILNQDYFSVIYHTNFGVKDKKKQEFTPDLTNKIIHKSNQFLQSSIFSFSTYKDIKIWDVTDGSEAIIYPKIRIRKYPYSEQEKSFIVDAQDLIKETSKYLNNYLSDAQVNISRHSYKDVALYFEIYQICSQELEKLQKVFELLHHPAYQYIDRGEVFPFVFKDIEYPEIVEYEFHDKFFEEEVSFPEGLKLHDISISKLYDRLQKLNEYVIETEKIIQPIIEKNRKRIEISDKEDSLFFLRDSLVHLFINKNGLNSYNDYHKRYSKDIVAFSEDTFKDYAKLTIEERIEQIDGVLSCYNEFFDLYGIFEGLPKKLQRMEEIYTRTVWNPFTFTDMDEIVKERIYNAFKNILFEYLLDEIEKSISCHSIINKADNFRILYNKMLDLREQDTQEIEKKLKRTTNVNTIIEALEIELYLN